MRLPIILALAALASCTSDFERSVQDRQRRAAAIQSATLVVEYHRAAEDPARPDSAADQRLSDAYMTGCGKAALRRFDDALARDVPFAVASRDAGQTAMLADAAAFDAESDRCFASLQAHGRVTWLVGERELGASQLAVEVATVMSSPDGRTAPWLGIGGCGSRGGPGYRLASGKCAGWSN